jgi:hypothetical protein
MIGLQEPVSYLFFPTRGVDKPGLDHGLGRPKAKNVNMQLHACEGPSPFSPFRVLAAMATDASVCDAHREARGQKVLPGAFPFLTSHRLVGSARADPSPFTAPTVAIPKVLHSHKGQARGRGL